VIHVPEQRRRRKPGAATRRAPAPQPGARMGSAIGVAVVQVLGFIGRQIAAGASLLWDMLCTLVPQGSLRRLTASAGLRTRLLVLAAVATAPIWALNLAVAFFGHTVVFPLSPFFMREKAIALGSYAAHRSTCWWSGHPEVEALIARAERQHHLPRALLAAVIHVESGGHPHRISGAGAMGLGQLMPETARLLGVSDPFDSAANVDGAARLLADHLVRYHDNVRLAVAAYNAGPGAVRGRVPDNGQTPAYVAKVLQVRAALRTLEQVAPPRRLALIRYADPGADRDR
jgi:hypothetical protein